MIMSPRSLGDFSDSHFYDLESMSTKDSFVHVKTLYSNNDYRLVSELSRAYANSELLRESIGRLIERQLVPESIYGKRVLFKPNWVRHQVSENDRYSLCTNESFILSALNVVLALKPASVVIGDAPIQGCNWSRLHSENFNSEIEARSAATGISIKVKDFRRVVFDPEANDLTQAKDNLDEFIIFDLGSRSFLEPITHPKDNCFRVTAYNPDRFLESHRPGIHKYCISRDVFDADLIISMPKIKTHQKAGITAALKNIVGINGDKDFLPHHRLGGTSRGGDCYPGGSRLRYLSELCYDQGNRYRGNWRYKFWTRTGTVLWRLSLPKKVHQPGAGWYGNDTTWRMVMDLNLILTYGTKDGNLAASPQRTMFSLCDGIVGGQGDGPLKPEPLPLGVITFSNNSALNDICCAALMRMDATRIPLLVAASSMFDWPSSQIRVNEESVSYDELSQFSIETKMPPGWLDYRSGPPISGLESLMRPQY